MIKASDQVVIAVVCAIYDFCNYSTSCHIPLEAISSHFPTDLRGDCKESNKVSLEERTDLQEGRREKLWTE